MANFQHSYTLVGDAEGGYQAHPADTGNYNSRGQLVGTNRGISAPSYESWIGRPPSQADMQAITPTEARDIYYQKYWMPIRGNEINDQGIADILFDGVVQHGRFGVELMQRLLSVTDDGIVGRNTLGAINAADPKWVVPNYRDARKVWYDAFVEADPSQKVFYQGWMNRLAKFGGSSSGKGGWVLLSIGALMLLLAKNAKR